MSGDVNGGVSRGVGVNWPVKELYLVLCLRDSFHIFTLKVMFIVPITFITEMTFIGKITKTAFNFQYFQCSASFPL